MCSSRLAPNSQPQIDVVVFNVQGFQPLRANSEQRRSRLTISWLDPAHLLPHHQERWTAPSRSRETTARRLAVCRASASSLTTIKPGRSLNRWHLTQRFISVAVEIISQTLCASAYADVTRAVKSIGICHIPTLPRQGMDWAGGGCWRESTSWGSPRSRRGIRRRGRCSTGCNPSHSNPSCRRCSPATIELRPI